MTKKEARKKALEIRKNIENNSELIIKDLIDSHILDKFNKIGIYYPIGNEVNVLSLLDNYPDKSFYLPITREEISFYPFKKGDLLIDGAFHTKEPILTKVIDRDLIEAFVIPSVAINKEGYRLGYGKGYYDRYLSGYKGLKIGVIYNSLADFDFENDSFDVKFNYIYKE